MNEFVIGHRKIGQEHAPVVIAEIGINHGGSLEEAIKIADAAIAGGAEIIKHQTHICEDEMSEEAKHQIPSHADKSIYEIMEECALNEADEFKLMNHINSRGAVFISSPFSRMAADRLSKFEVPAFKIGSGECNNYPLVKHIAGFGKPVIMSTGMNSIESIRPSVEILRSHDVPFALLHCTNVYPTPANLVRLDAISVLQSQFPDAVVGLSDHTTGNYTCFGACALGASILERHFTDTMDRDGPDISCSMDPDGLTDLIRGSKVIHSARGQYKGPIEDESSTIAFAFASVVAIGDIKAGETLSMENIWVRRPSGGDYSAKDFDALIGRVVCKDVTKGQRIKRTDLGD